MHHHRISSGSTPTWAPTRHAVIRAPRRPSSPTPAAPRDADQLDRRRAGPRGDLRHRAARRHRDPALPHAGASTMPTLAFARLAPAVDFGAKDGPADLAFLIAAPAGGDADPPEAADQAGPRAGQAGLHRRAARGRDRRRGRRRSSTRSVVEPAAARRPPTAAAAAAARRRRRRRRRATADGAVARRRHRLPDRHRPHLHGRRGPRGRRRARRRRHRTSRPRARPAPRRSPRRRSPRAAAVIFAIDVGVTRPRPVRRQADGRLRRQAGRSTTPTR